MNLETESLIPLKTIAKMRDGRAAVFINAEGGNYRFCPPGSAGTYTVYSNGRRGSASRDDTQDIVAIAKKWKPVAGESVTVCGLTAKVDPDGAHMTRSVRFTNGHDSFAPQMEIAENDEGGECPDHINFYHIVWEGQNLCVHRDNLRRVK